MYRTLVDRFSGVAQWEENCHSGEGWHASLYTPQTPTKPRSGLQRATTPPPKPCNASKPCQPIIAMKLPRAPLTIIIIIIGGVG